MAGKGRPNKYSSNVEPYLDDIRKMALTMTERQIAKTLDVSYSSFREYKQHYPALNDALKKGRRELVSELRSTLIQKAKGYDYTEKKVVTEKMRVPENMRKRLLEMGLSKEEIDEAKIVKTEVLHKHLHPDVAALNLALKNYDREHWANDPQMLALRKKELELRERQVENNEW